MSLGNYASGGVQRSYSFPFFHGDMIPYSAVAVNCPNVACEQVFLQNDPNSTGNIVVGDYDTLSATGHGVVLAPGNVSGWIPVQNLALIAHKDAAGSHLNYWIVR